MSSTNACGVPSNIALITGPYVLGGVFSYGLFGILIVQLFFYQYTFYHRDPTWLKIFVWVLALLDLVITIMWTVFMWEILASHWGDPTILTNVKTAEVIPLLSGIVGSMAHFFYAWRIYRLTRSMVIPIPVILISLTTCAMAGYSGIKGAEIGTARFSEMDPEVSTWLGGSTLADFLITAVLVLQLFRYNKRSSSSQTRDALQRLITLTVETGLVTALTALLELLLFILFKENTLYFIPLFMLSKVYSNCLLATLNTRSIINHQTGSGNKHPLWVDLDDTGTFMHGPTFGPNPAVPTPPRVFVGTLVHHDRDIEMASLQDSKEEINISPPNAAKSRGRSSSGEVTFTDLSRHSSQLKS
ncbi:hypothetical protein J3R30DRAFT_616360 [Lentinula aciculospora]|uniref:DUF6534 domain-containing protein n=1 Tax=Lentinula aciculospora TaxID=153920 RepID=A0A9W9A7X7_9AGAR|nr:hypothetical protein J3R30DRAFT_616360 [Lentinula aciculospora]